MVVLHRGPNRNRCGIVSRDGVVDLHLMVIAVFVQYAGQDYILAHRPVLRIEGERAGHGNPRPVPAFRRHGHRSGRLCCQAHLIRLILQDGLDIQTLVHDYDAVREDERRIIVRNGDRQGCRACHVVMVPLDRVAQRSRAACTVVVLHAGYGDGRSLIPVRRIQRDRPGHRRDRLIVALRRHGHRAPGFRCQLYGVGGGAAFEDRHRLPVEQHCRRGLAIVDGILRSNR